MNSVFTYPSTKFLYTAIGYTHRNTFEVLVQNDRYIHNSKYWERKQGYHQNKKNKNQNKKDNQWYIEGDVKTIINQSIFSNPNKTTSGISYDKITTIKNQIEKFNNNKKGNILSRITDFLSNAINATEQNLLNIRLKHISLDNSAFSCYQDVFTNIYETCNDLFVILSNHCDKHELIDLGWIHRASGECLISVLLNSQQEMKLIHCIWYMYSIGVEIYFTIMPYDLSNKNTNTDDKNYNKKNENILDNNNNNKIQIVQHYFEILRNLFKTKISNNILEDISGLKIKQFDNQMMVEENEEMNTIAIGRLQNSTVDIFEKIYCNDNFSTFFFHDEYDNPCVEKIINSSSSSSNNNSNYNNNSDSEILDESHHYPQLYGIDINDGSLLSDVPGYDDIQKLQNEANRTLAKLNNLLDEEDHFL